MKQKNAAPIYYEIKNAGIELSTLAEIIGITRAGLSFWFLEEELSLDRIKKIADALKVLAARTKELEKSMREIKPTKKSRRNNFQAP